MKNPTLKYPTLSWKWLPPTRLHLEGMGPSVADLVQVPSDYSFVMCHMYVYAIHIPSAASVMRHSFLSVSGKSLYMRETK